MPVGRALPRGLLARHPRAAAFVLAFLLGWVLCSGPIFIPLSLQAARRFAILLMAGSAVLAQLRFGLLPERAALRRRFRLALIFLLLGLALLLPTYILRVRLVPVEAVGATAAVPLGLFTAKNCCKGEGDELCIGSRGFSDDAIRQCWTGVSAVRATLVLSYWLTTLAAGAVLGLLLQAQAAPLGGMPPMRKEPPPRPESRDLFLSYSREDLELVERLVADLKERGFVVRWDQEEARVGDDFLKKIEKAIWESAWFVLVLSPNAMASPWVDKEVAAALIRQAERDNRPFILPLLYEKCEVSPFLRALTWADFTHSYEQGLAQLLDVLAAA